MIVGPPRIAALCALSVGMLLLATGGPSVTSGSPAAQETFTGSTEPVVAPTPAGRPLGVSGRLPFRVQTFRGPDRLAIDVGHAVEAQEPAGLPQTGERSPSYSSSWPVGVSLAGMLVLLSGAVALAVAVKRR